MSFTFPLTLHGHPTQTHYRSEAEFPAPISAQGHWNAPPPGHAGHDHHVGHGHVELFAPVYAELPHAPFTIRGRIQLFHVAGRCWGVFPWMMASLVWDDGPTTLPIEGNPADVVVKWFTLTIDPTLPYPNGSGGDQLRIPENGWYHVRVDAFTNFDNDGSVVGASSIVPFYAIGDPAVPESSSDYALSGFYFTLAAKASAAQTTGNRHGEPAAEFRDTYAPIGAITAPITVSPLTWAYARVGNWPAPELDRMKVLLDPDLHAGIPGTVLADVPGDQFNFTRADVVLDPAVIGPGAHKLMVTWEQNSGPVGDPTRDIAPNEFLSSLLVIPFTVGDGGGPVDPPPVDPPVDCAGTWGPVVEVNGEIKRVFTPTQQPAHGGKSCLLVAGETA